VGDVTYGSGVINRHYRAEYNLHRLALHASRLVFEHPATGARVVVDAPLPEDLVTAFLKLGLPTQGSGADVGAVAAEARA
jgi:tRNA pseudouridine65 synthase